MDDARPDIALGLSEILDGSHRPPAVNPPSFEVIQRTIRRVLDRYDAPAKLPEHEAEKLLVDMLRRVREHDWHKVPMSFVTKVAGLAFAAPWRDRDDLAPVRQFLIAEIRASDRSGFLGPMVRIYIESHVTGAHHSAELAAALAASRGRIGARWQELLSSIPDLFDPDGAPGTIAARMDGMDDPWHGLRAIGLRQPHAPGLMDAAHLAFLSRVAPRLDQRAQIERLLGWLKPDGQTLRTVGAGAAITALIRPWMERQPPKDILTLLTDRLTEFYGHPRVNRHAAWNEVDPAAEKVFLRWLMGADIRFLFRVLTEVERGHMWADREDFWWTRYEQGRIDEVWIAFNADGYRTALNKLPANQRHGARRFAEQTGESDKSLLIMRIGTKIIVEGTYSFAVHAFDINDPKAPKLYRSTYDAREIRAKHSAHWTEPHRGYWQDRVERRLGK